MRFRPGAEQSENLTETRSMERKTITTNGGDKSLRVPLVWRGLLLHVRRQKA